jgi:hypothetical protein
MLNIFTLILVSFVFFFSLFEIIIFNEEIFLAVCFVAFLFVGYANFNRRISFSFENRTKIFALDLFFSLYCDFFVLYYNSQENLLFNYLVKIDTDFMLLDFCNHLTNFLNGIFALDLFTSCANSTFFNFTQYFASEFKTFLVVREKYTLAVLYSLPFVKKSYGLCATNFTIKLGL